MTESSQRVEIENYLRQQHSRPKSRWANLGLLILSVVLFISLGMFQNPLSGILTLVMVVFIHEAGHFLAMKIFGCPNVNILFIPLFGAVTTGAQGNLSGAKKAIVSLMGPLPGILIGIVLGILFIKTREEIYVQPARMFLFLNAFNLLPFYPLDGGRFIDDILFPRNVKIEILFKIVSGLGLVVVAIFLKSFLLGAFAIGFLVSTKKIYHIGILAKELKEEIPLEDQVLDVEVQKKYIPQISAYLKNKLTIQPAPREVAIHIINTWQRLCNLPPKKGAAFGLAFVYILSIFVSIASTGVFEIAVMYTKRDLKLVSYQAADGTPKIREDYFYEDSLCGSTEVSEDNLYHGQAVSYFPDTGRIQKVGQWSHGKWDGEWRTYDRNGQVIRVTLFDKGHLVLIKEFQDGKWVEKTLDDYSQLMQMPFRQHETGPPVGPKQNQTS